MISCHVTEIWMPKIPLPPIATSKNEICDHEMSSVSMLRVNSATIGPESVCCGRAAERDADVPPRMNMQPHITLSATEAKAVGVS